jgi:hypothetical protein
MKEDFLHYLWKFKKFDVLKLKTTNSEEVIVTSSGQYLQTAGPDFFNAKIIIAGQLWAGNVEIHLKSSDWYVHHHERDDAYDTIILHVVWEHDTEVYRKNNEPIPVVELRNYVAAETLLNYQSLMTPKSWIYCEKSLENTDEFLLKMWQERLFIERLERKSLLFQDILNRTENDWEAVLFCSLAKNFGLNVNGSTFLKIAERIPFTVIRKESSELENLEALLFGVAGLLAEEKEDTYYKDLQARYSYLVRKYKLDPELYLSVQFFKLRPDNFPTIRLSQLANLYYSHRNLFSKIIENKSLTNIYTIFNVAASTYWENHYLFDKASNRKSKKLSKGFIDLLVINTLIPLQFAYSRSIGLAIGEDLIDLLKEIAPEKNTIIDKFNFFGLKSANAFETQALLQLKNEYCAKNSCLECAIGMELMKKE